MKAVRSPPCAQCVFCGRAHRLREAIGRHVRRGRTCRYGGFASGDAAAAWRDIAARSSPACHCAANISRNSGKDARKPAFRGLSAAIGVRIFFRARGSAPDFPAAARRSGKMRCRRFRSGRLLHSRRALSFLGIRIGASEMGAGWGILRPIFREISSERSADWKNN